MGRRPLIKEIPKIPDQPQTKIEQIDGNGAGDHLLPMQNNYLQDKILDTTTE